MTWLNDTLQGIFVGGGYALTAVGLSLMFGVMRLVNMAHGDLAVCATYLVTTVMAALGMPFLAALLLMLPVAFAAGAVLQLALFDRALRTGPLAPLLVTFGLSIMIENLLQQTYSANVRGVPAGSIDVGDGSYLLAVPSSVHWMARRYQAPSLTVILDNQGWKAPSLSTLAVHPAGELAAGGFAASFQPEADLPEVAAAAGGAYARTVTAAARLPKALGEALAQVRGGRSAVVSVHVAPV